MRTATMKVRDLQPGEIANDRVVDVSEAHLRELAEDAAEALQKQTSDHVITVSVSMKISALVVRAGGEKNDR